MRSKYERGLKQGVKPTAATRGTHSKRSIFRRTLFLMVLCGMVIFIPLGWKLWDIAIVNCEAYQKAAQNQHGLDFVIPAERGKIYDRNSNVMAMSTTVYTLILSPRDLVKSVSNKDEEGNTLSDEVYQAKVAARQDQMVEELMNLIPDLDRQEVEGHVHATKMAYREIKVNIEEEEHKRIQEYIVENKASSYLYQIAGSKRYYPYSGLAAQALGFVNANGGVQRCAGGHRRPGGHHPHRRRHRAVQQLRGVHRRGERLQYHPHH